jgi:hypothetical protein
LPVPERARGAAHPQPAGLAAWQLAAVLVADAHLEAGYHLAKRSGARGPGRLLMKMCHISAVPRPSRSSTPNVSCQRWKQLRRQRLACRRHDAQRLDVRARRARMPRHLVDHRRHVDEHGGRNRRMRANTDSAVAGSGKSATLAPAAKREEQVRAGGIPEVELRHGERDVALAVADHAVAVERGRVRERAVRLDDCFGFARGAAREEPQRGIVPVRVERGPRRGVRASRSANGGPSATSSSGGEARSRAASANAGSEAPTVATARAREYSRK